MSCSFIFLWLSDLSFLGEIIKWLSFCRLCSQQKTVQVLFFYIKFMETFEGCILPQPKKQTQTLLNFLNLFIYFYFTESFIYIITQIWDFYLTYVVLGDKCNPFGKNYSITWSWNTINLVVLPVEAGLILTVKPLNHKKCFAMI